MADTPIDGIRTDLEAERDELRGRVAELTADGAAAPDFDENFADSGQVAAELGENLALAATLRDQLEQVEAALARIDEGTYGRCTVCGEPIADARLEAVPSASVCIAHA